MHPYNPTVLLSHCPQLHHLGSSEVEVMIDRLKPLVEVVKLTGEATDQQMMEAVGDFINFESVRPVDGLVLNHRRAVWIKDSIELQRREEKKRREIEAKNLSSATPTLINVEPVVGVTCCYNLNCNAICASVNETWK